MVGTTGARFRSMTTSQKQENKIDGVVGLIMALNRVQYYEEGAGVSVYEERGLLEV